MNPLKISSNVNKNSFIENLAFLCLEDTLAIGERRKTVESPLLSIFDEQTTASVTWTDTLVFFVAGTKVSLAAVAGEEIAIAIEAVK